MVSTIQSLIDDGTCVLFQDYRASSTDDFTTNGNDVTTVAGNPIWSRHGYKYNIGDKLQVAAAASINDLTDRTYVIGTNAKSAGESNSGRLISKGGIELLYAVGRVSFGAAFSGANGSWSNPAASITNGIHQTISVSYNSSSTANDPVFYVNGVLGATSEWVAPTGSVNSEAANDLVIGNNVGAVRTSDFTVDYVAVFNRTLTAAEHMALCGDLCGLNWPTKPQSRDTGGYRWVSGWGARTIMNVAPGSRLPDTQFMVDSGAYAVTTETVGGRVNSKVIECTNAGILHLEGSEIRDGRADNAYGTWDFWMLKGLTASIPRVYFIAATAAGGAGYHLYSNGAADNVILYETGVGAKMTSENNVIAAGAWNHYKVTRAAGGVFTVYLNGTALPAVSGANPATDNTTTTSDFIVFDLDAGDKICLGDIRGRGAFAKHHGVV